MPNIIDISTFVSRDLAVSDRNLANYAKAFAQDLTEQNRNLFIKIPPSDFVTGPEAYKKSGNKSAFNKWQDQFKNTLEMVTTDVLLGSSKDHQKRIYAFYMKVADECLKNNDFETAYAISSALNSNPIDRLKYIAEEQPDNIKRSNQKHQALNDGRDRFRNYRAALSAQANAKGAPPIPRSTAITGVYTTAVDVMPDEDDAQKKVKAQKAVEVFGFNVLDHQIKLSSQAPQEPQKPRTNIAQKLSEPKLASSSTVDPPEFGTAEHRSYEVKPGGKEAFSDGKSTKEYIEKLEDLKVLNIRVDPSNIAQQLITGNRIQRNANLEISNNSISKNDCKNIASVICGFQSPKDIIVSLVQVKNTINGELNKHPPITKDQHELLMKDFNENTKVFLSALIKANPTHPEIQEISQHLEKNNRNDRLAAAQASNTSSNKFISHLSSLTEYTDSDTDGVKASKIGLYTELKEAVNYNKNKSRINPDAFIDTKAKDVENIDQFFNSTLADRSPNAKKVDDMAKKVSEDLRNANMAIIMKMSPAEFHGEAWNKNAKESTSPNILAFIKQTNSTINTIRDDILITSNRAQQQNVYNFYCKVLDKAVENNDFMTVMNIASAFESSPVSRLKLKTDPTAKAILKKHKDILDSTGSYKLLARASDAAEGLAVPYVNQSLTSLTNAAENAGSFMHNEQQFANLFKHMVNGKIIGNIQDFQSRMYDAALKDGVQPRQTTMITKIRTPSLTDGEAYQRSMSVQARAIAHAEGEGPAPAPFSGQNITAASDMRNMLFDRLIQETQQAHAAQEAEAQAKAQAAAAAIAQAAARKAEIADTIASIPALSLDKVIPSIDAPDADIKAQQDERASQRVADAVASVPKLDLNKVTPSIEAPDAYIEAQQDERKSQRVTDAVAETVVSVPKLDLNKVKPSIDAPDRVQLRQPRSLFDLTAAAEELQRKGELKHTQAKEKTRIDVVEVPQDVRGRARKAPPAQPRADHQEELQAPKPFLTSFSLDRDRKSLAAKSAAVLDKKEELDPSQKSFADKRSLFNKKP